MSAASIKAGVGDDSFVVRADSVTLSYGSTEALRDISLNVPAGCMVGLIGPDGVGKSSLLSLIAGARVMQKGKIEVLGGDIADKRHRQSAFPRIAYMPQGLGKTFIRRSLSSRTSSSLGDCLGMTSTSVSAV